MHKHNIYSISSVLLTSFLLVGCYGGMQTASPTGVTAKTTINKINSTQNKGIKLSELKNLGTVSNLQLQTKKSYALNESIQFIIDTGKSEGFLYILYLDSKGKTELLYPNANAPLSEMGGEFLFPKDFGNMNIRATKDCKGCTEEQTTIYALLSKRPIIDINNITKSDLLKLTSNSSQSRGLSLELNNNKKTNSNLNVGKVNFFVR